MAQFRLNRKAQSELTKEIVERVCVPMMQRVADACNQEAGLEDGFRVSVEGDDPLDKRDYRATAIAATAEAIRYDHKHDALLHNFGEAG
ncbi:hypothetical protein [Mycobacteroides abscessus]|uniref:hypothetical protein n=1 Tax=Mycobacteroides abscessus TaxID=36809 RepID=UPI000465491E|nr:hypothetical protein [Mycobacteroides abscessus]ORA92099.1 hypothetical protein BST32_01605 [Mycobacteroides abscessus subsp. massiliense]WJJ56414.1 hypothetical protein PROPHICCUG48898T2_87 [Mycobacterium phage CCUG48898T-2]